MVMIVKSIYIFGHKNPDTDSVCSAIALAYLKNAQNINATAKVIGQINNGTKYVLDYFNVPLPSYINDVKVQIKDLKYEKGAFINEKASIGNTIRFMRQKDLNAIPIVNDKNILTGYVNLKDIVNYLALTPDIILDTSLENIVTLLDAKVLCNPIENVKGHIKYITCSNEEFNKNQDLDSDTILVVGDRYHIVESALNKKVKMIILTKNRTISQRLIRKAQKNNVCVINSPNSTASLCTLLPNTNFIKNLNPNTNNLTTVNIHSYYTDFLSLSKRISYTNYPVVKDNNECLGVIKVTHMTEYEKKKVILVDHNNYSQSVDGLEEADILEIIDHHNLGDIGTSAPITFLCKPVGCTATIIYEQFKKEKIKIPHDIAGLLLSAVISDTLLFTSPTTTKDDITAANELAKIAKVDINEYGIKMLKAASSIKGLTISELIHQDFKTYTINNKNYGIAVITTMDFDEIEKDMDKYIAKLDEMSQNNFKAVLIFITDILKKGSYVIYNENSKNLVKNAFNLKDINEGEFLPGLISRKKQILPAIMKVVD